MRSLLRNTRQQTQVASCRDISCQTNNGDEHIGLEEKLRMIDHAYAKPLTRDFDKQHLDELEEKGLIGGLSALFINIRI